MSSWGWKPARSEGIWRYGPLWLKPLCAAIPWITAVLLLAMLFVIGNTMTLSEGVLFSLPERTEVSDGEPTSLVALAMPVAHDTLVFFDDARYNLGDEASGRLLSERLAERAAKVERRTLLVLCDRRVTGGELMRLAGLARGSGVERVLFATKNAEAGRSE